MRIVKIGRDMWMVGVPCEEGGSGHRIMPIGSGFRMMLIGGA
jgi:hypothetical protein